MKVRCIRPFGHHVPGDETEVPDGAEVDPNHYEPVTAPAPPPAPDPPQAAAPGAVFPKGM